MKIGFSIFISGVFVLASCTMKQKRADYLIKIDSLSSVLANDIHNYKSIDSSLIRLKMKKMDSQLVVLDSIDSLSFITEKVAYRELYQSFMLFLKENPQIISEAHTCRTQLANLKFDTENKLIHTNQVQIYFEQESKAVNSLQNKMDLFQKKINSQMNKYDLLHTKLAHSLDSLL